MRYSLCIDMIYVTRGPHGWIFATSEQLLAGMELAARLGLPGVEFWAWEGRDLPALARRQQELGLEVTALCVKDGDRLGQPDALPALRQGLQQSLAVARDFDCRRLILNANLCPRDAARAEVLRNMAASLRELAGPAEDAGVTLLLEPLSEGFFRSSAEAFEVVQAAQSPAVRLLYDLYLFQLIEGNLTGTLREKLPLIGEIHAAGVPDRGTLLTGEVDYRYLLQQLRALGYDGWFCLEFFTFAQREQQLQAACALLREMEQKG